MSILSYIPTTSAFGSKPAVNGFLNFLVFLVHIKMNVLIWPTNTLEMGSRSQTMSPGLQSVIGGICPVNIHQPRSSVRKGCRPAIGNCLSVAVVEDVSKGAEVPVVKVTAVWVQLADET